MKRCIVLLLLILFLAIFSHYYFEPSLELISSNVTILNDKEVVGSIGINVGEQKEREVVPTALYYEFKIKNVGNKNININDTYDLKVKLEPNNKLKEVSEETVGINIFDPSSYMATGLGYGESSSYDFMKKGEEGEVTFTFDLGVSERIPEVRLITPSEEKLEKLLNYALDASLIVIFEDEEIARFNLNEK
ncbi:hypothetical protein [Anaerovorax sp. IOR16]|uniref:hypothetical protein n=1 Tax=Anaerovorax sp. IOR16 TaxID=2773458 RepID=UPI0019D10845|nr:hypothetical protein [Anaerovorax sp. IOR16]